MTAGKAARFSLYPLICAHLRSSALQQNHLAPMRLFDELKFREFAFDDGHQILLSLIAEMRRTQIGTSSAGPCPFKMAKPSSRLICSSM